MSLREDQDRNKSCPSRGLGLAAAAIGVGVGAAFFYFFNKRAQNPNGEGSTTEWECEQSHALNSSYEDSDSSSDDSYTTESANTTTDTSMRNYTTSENDTDTDTDSEPSTETELDSSQLDDPETDESMSDYMYTDEEDDRLVRRDQSDSVNSVLTMPLTNMLENLTNESLVEAESTESEYESDSSGIQELEEIEEFEVAPVNSQNSQYMSLANMIRSYIESVVDELESTTQPASTTGQESVATEQEPNLEAPGSQRLDMEVARRALPRIARAAFATRRHILGLTNRRSRGDGAVVFPARVISTESDLSQFNTMNNSTNVSVSENEWDVTTTSEDIPSVDRGFITAISSMVSNMFSPGRVPDEAERMRDQQFRERTWSPEDCSICFDVMVDPQEVVSLPCTHRFHQRCILPWLRERSTCPYCRKPAECEPISNRNNL